MFLSVNHKLFRTLNDYIFQQKSLKEIIDEYTIINHSKEDKDGKRLFQIISNELEARNKNRQELIEIIVDYLIEEQPESIKKILQFLNIQLS